MQINCPYCNTLIDPASLARAETRVRCPRCGDSFPNRWLDEHAAADTGKLSDASQPQSAEHIRRANRVAAFCVLGIMVSMAAAGLFYALHTAPERQSRHPDPIKVFASQPYRPSELAALGYLPFDTRIAAGVHLADLRRDPLGQKLLEAPRWQPLDWALERIKLWADLPVDTIDHLAFGLNMPKDELPTLVMAVQTRRPYRINALRQRHTDAPADEFYNRPLFRFRIQPLGEGYLWCADDRTLVFLLRADHVDRAHLDRIPFKAHQGMEGLPEALQELIKERLPPQPLAWIVGDLEGSELFSNNAALAPFAGKFIESLSRLKSLAAGVQFQNDVTVAAAFEARDVTAAYALQALLEKRGQGAIKLAGLPPANVLAARCVAQAGGYDPFTLPTLLSQTRVLAQYRGDADSVRRQLALP